MKIACGYCGNTDGFREEPNLKKTGYCSKNCRRTYEIVDLGWKHPKKKELLKAIALYGRCEFSTIGWLERQEKHRLLTSSSKNPKIIIAKKIHLD